MWPAEKKETSFSTSKQIFSKRLVHQGCAVHTQLQISLLESSAITKQDISDEEICRYHAEGRKSQCLYRMCIYYSYSAWPHKMFIYWIHVIKLKNIAFTCNLVHVVFKRQHLHPPQHCRQTNCMSACHWKPVGLLQWYFLYFFKHLYLGLGRALVLSAQLTLVQNANTLILWCPWSTWFRRVVERNVKRCALETLQNALERFWKAGVGVLQPHHHNVICDRPGAFTRAVFFWREMGILKIHNSLVPLSHQAIFTPLFPMSKD